MWIMCLDAVLVRLAVVYWAASLLILVCRLVWPDFQQLAAYGGHGETATAPHTHSATEAKGTTNTNAALSTRQKVDKQGLLGRLMAAVQRSPLGTVRVTRQQAFTAFYLTGIATSTLLLLLFTHRSVVRQARVSLAAARSGIVTATPSMLFTLHCAVRLLETRLVQRFRSADSVTLFAAIAGSTFYAAAAVSLAVPSTVVATAATRWLAHAPLLQCCFVVGAAAHLVLQGAQVKTHTILAGLRQPPRVSRQEEKDVWRRVQAVLATAAAAEAPTAEPKHGVGYALQGPWISYHFPFQKSTAFQMALDPHYTYEVLLYLVHTLMIVLCTLPYALPSAVTGEVMLTTLSHGGCAPVEWLSLLASAGVTIFTLLNLGITSSEHRRFWNESNAVRGRVAQALTRLLQADDVAGDEPRLPPGLVAAATRLLQEMVPEELPPWNVVPYVW